MELAASILRVEKQDMQETNMKQAAREALCWVHVSFILRP
jgi:hypothetical protein